MSSPLDKTLKLPPATYALVRRIADAEARTLRAVVERALRKYSPKVAAEVKQQKESV